MLIRPSDRLLDIYCSAKSSITNNKHISHTTDHVNYTHKYIQPWNILGLGQSMTTTLCKYWSVLVEEQMMTVEETKMKLVFWELLGHGTRNIPHKANSLGWILYTLYTSFFLFLFTFFSQFFGILVFCFFFLRVITDACYRSLPGTHNQLLP